MASRRQLSVNLTLFMVLLAQGSLLSNDLAAFPIPAGLEDAVVLIEVIRIEDDSVHYRPLGTGFLLQDTAVYDGPLLITNRHLLKGRDSVYLRFNFSDGQATRLVARLRRQDGTLTWKSHGDTLVDVAAAPLRSDLPVKSVFNRYRRARVLRDVDLGDEVYFVGFPLAEYTHTGRNYPVLRHGVVSYISRETIFAKSPPDSVILLRDMILIDATSLGGNSGSPVLSVPKRGDTRAELIGIIHGHLLRGDSGENLDLGIVVPMDRIIDVLLLFK